MPRFFLIRHGAPSAAWGESVDPVLSDIGCAQAAATADRLAIKGRLELMTSPTRRRLETAAPFEKLVGKTAQVEPRVSEVAAPAGVDDRQAWLQENFPWRKGGDARIWVTLAPPLHAWRENVLRAVRVLKCDTAIVTHFIAINVLVGASAGQQETIVCRPDHASVTELALEDGALRLVALGVGMGEGEVR